METFPIHSPPKTPGIYGLKNAKTGEIYVGQTVSLTRRYGEWKSLFQTKIGRTSCDMMDAARRSEPKDWEFIVIATADRSELNALEAKAIATLREKHGDKCLNRTVEEALVKASEVNWLPKTRILGPNGPMTYTEAAETLRVSPESLKKRLAVRRKRGVFEVAIESLRT
jgi:hypothetical protein